MEQVFSFVILTLITYYFTIALAYSEGPWGSFDRLRNKKWMSEFGLMACYICISVYPAIITALLMGLPWYYGLAAAGLTVLIERLK